MPVQIGLARLSLDDNTITRIADAALESVPRGDAEDAEIDLWCKNIAGLPGTAVPVLVHEVFCEIEWFEQIVWFNRTDTRDQLWACTDLDLEIKRALHGAPPTARPQRLAGFGQHAACVMSVKREGAFDESLLELLAGYFSTQAGAPGGIEHLIATAYINRAHVRTILECVERYRERKRVEHEEFSRQARENETEIIHAARELGLHPEPAGIGPIQWYANCPRTSGHRLRITTSKDHFGCGYCRVNGGVDELRAFHAAHQQPADKKTRQTTATTQHDETGEI